MTGDTEEQRVSTYIQRLLLDPDTNEGRIRLRFLKEEVNSYCSSCLQCNEPLTPMTLPCFVQFPTQLKAVGIKPQSVGMEKPPKHRIASKYSPPEAVKHFIDMLYMHIMEVRE